MAIARLREVRVPWTAQPQEVVGINFDHPLAAALQYLWLPDTVAAVDLISGLRCTGAPSTVSMGVAPEGRVWQGVTSSATGPNVPAQTYPFVAVMQGVMAVNNGWQLLSLGASGAYLTVDVSSSHKVELLVRRNFGTGRILATAGSYPAGTLLTIIVQVFSDTDYRLYVNGEQVNGTLSFGTGGTWVTGLTPIGAMLSGRQSLLGFGSGKASISDAFALEVTQSPAALWGTFEPQRIWVPVTAGAGGAALASSSAAVCDGVGALTTLASLNGGAAAASSGSGVLTVQAAFAGGGAAGAAGSGTLTIGGSGAALTSSAGVATAIGAGTLTTAAALAASGAATANGVGAFTVAAALAGSGVAGAAGAGTLTTGTSGAALTSLTGAAQTSGMGTLSVRAALATTLAIAQAQATAALTVRAALAGAGWAAAGGGATLSAGEEPAVFTADSRLRVGAAGSSAAAGRIGDRSVAQAIRRIGRNRM